MKIENSHHTCIGTMLVCIIAVSACSGASDSPSVERTIEASSSQQRPLGGTYMVQTVIQLKRNLQGTEITVFGFLSLSGDGVAATYRLVPQKELMSASIGDSIKFVSLVVVPGMSNTASINADCIGDFVRISGDFDIINGNGTLTLGNSGFIVSYNGLNPRHCAI